MSETQRLRDKASHVRVMASTVSDEHARASLEALADELEQQALDREGQEQEQGSQIYPASRSDTP